MVGKPISGSPWLVWRFGRDLRGFNPAILPGDIELDHGAELPCLANGHGHRNVHSDCDVDCRADRDPDSDANGSATTAASLYGDADGDRDGRRDRDADNYQLNNAWSVCNKPNKPDAGSRAAKRDARAGNVDAGPDVSAANGNARARHRGASRHTDSGKYANTGRHAYANATNADDGEHSDADKQPNFSARCGYGHEDANPGLIVELLPINNSSQLLAVG